MAQSSVRGGDLRVTVLGIYGLCGERGSRLSRSFGRIYDWAPGPNTTRYSMEITSQRAQHRGFLQARSQRVWCSHTYGSPVRPLSSATTMVGRRWCSVRRSGRLVRYRRVDEDMRARSHPRGNILATTMGPVNKTGGVEQNLRFE